MRAWGSVKFSQFACGPRGFRLHGVRLNGVHLHAAAAVMAVLACFAVVLNLGPFAKTAKRDVAQPNTVAVAQRTDARDIFRLAVAEKSVGSLPVARLSSGSGAQTEHPQSTTDAINLAERFRPLKEFVAASEAAATRAVTQAVKPTDRDGELQAKPARQDVADSAVHSHASVIGVWAPDTGACSVRDFQEGLLPTVIKADGARAGETFCAFKKKQETKTGWRIVANCSNQHEHWTTEVLLAVKNNRLTWSSKRGTQSYKRCAPDFLMAAAR